jgi:hypothetical protein
MGYELNTEGFVNEWYAEGSASNAFLLDVFLTEGLFFEGVLGPAVTLILGVELTTIAGLGINWFPAAKEIEIHGRHVVATSPEDKNYNVINYTCTSEQSHTQTVNGPTIWINNGPFSLSATQSGAIIGIVAPADGEVFLTAGNGQFSLRTAQTALQGEATTVTGTTSAQLSGGGNSVLLKADEASLLCGTAGIKATAASTVISGTKVEIGVPNGPNSPVATEDQITGLQTNVNELQQDTIRAINRLKAQLDELKTKCVPKAQLLGALR